LLTITCVGSAPITPSKALLSCTRPICALPGRIRPNFADRNHFFAVAALSMRQILVEYARSRRAAKRDGGYKLTLDDAVSLLKGRNVELVDLDDALKDLSRLDPQQSQIVELRFFAGLSIEETAHVLGISPATVKRHWTTARVWLHREMSKVAET